MSPLSDLEQQRLAKAERIRQRGIDPYPPRVKRTHTTQEAIVAFEKAGEDDELTVSVVGRLMSVRTMGRSTFAHIADGSGRLQIYLRQDDLGQETYEFFDRDFDLGDFIGVTGTLFRTRTGEITVRVQNFEMLAKSLHPLPEKWHGLKDVETRYRHRYADLIANEDVRQVFITRTRIVSALRRFLDSRGFLEVETPILQPIYGGAAARPFVTYHNQLHQNLFLRISFELYLKRLIVGGYERVYEIGRDFRNEGVSYKHNPEFTQLEFYWAYADYNDLMDLTEEMIATVAQEVLGTTRITYQGHEIELAPPWRRIPLRQAILEETGIDYEAYPDAESLLQAIRNYGGAAEPKATRGKLIDPTLTNYVEAKLIQPTFLYDYPVEVSPLAKKKPDDPTHVERFEFFIGGLEMGNAFTELNDPVDQEQRFLEQRQAYAAGDEEAHPMDEDFLLALRYGMPPTAGWGMGVDRLTMLLTDQSSIRDVILFPHLRSKD
ncbi:MAG: lysine--tRNA ligase [Anaerolineae bacterium]|jgi:lysyl-tRNA synthetase class 2|nr:lysine--tRNA ligase [Anaerolineae bacterium]MDH7472951.1 lysine--tRNA ligase [Anaerolineae bacterium]